MRKQKLFALIEKIGGMILVRYHCSVVVMYESQESIGEKMSVVHETKCRE